MTEALTHVVWKRILDDATLEFASLSRGEHGFDLVGRVVGVDDNRPLYVEYRLTCDARWHSRELIVSQTLGTAQRELRLEGGQEAGWCVNGSPRPDLAGCIDIDLGISPSTNALAINRLRLPIGQGGDVLAAWVRFPGLEVQPARQRYERTAENAFKYRSLASGFEAALETDSFALPISYEGVWQRLADTRVG